MPMRRFFVGLWAFTAIVHLVVFAALHEVLSRLHAPHAAPIALAVTVALVVLFRQRLHLVTHDRPISDLRRSLELLYFTHWCGAVAGSVLCLAFGACLLAGSLAPRVPAVAGTGASRLSRLTTGTRLVHADLHNHTLLSDGDGDPAEAFASMRSAGPHRDVAGWGLESVREVQDLDWIDLRRWRRRVCFGVSFEGNPRRRPRARCHAGGG